MSQKFDAASPKAPDAAPAIRVAVCGEVSSGKSTVLNAMLRAPIFPDNLGSRCRPVIVAGYRTEPGMDILYPDGTRTTVGTLDDPDLLRDAAHVTLWSDQAHIAGLEVVEVPLTKAEMLTDDQVEIIRSSDVMIWVTIASQAWRLTEKTIVDQLGDARPSCAILAVTRADKLRNERDRERLKDRIVRETAQYFLSCVFINGTRKKIGNSGSCDEAWNETGVVEILSTIRSHAGGLSEDRADCAGEESEPRSEIAEIAEIVDLDGLRAPPEADGAEEMADAPDSDVPASEVPGHDP